VAARGRLRVWIPACAGMTHSEAAIPTWAWRGARGGKTGGQVAGSRVVSGSGGTKAGFPRRGGDAEVWMEGGGGVEDHGFEA